MTAKDIHDELEEIFKYNENQFTEVSKNEFGIIKAERDEMMNALIDKYYTAMIFPDNLRLSQNVKLKEIIERATGMTIDEAIKAYEGGGK